MHVCGCGDGEKEGGRGGGMDGWIKGRMEGWMDGWRGEGWWDCGRNGEKDR